MFFSIIQIIADTIEEVEELYRNMMNAVAYRVLQNYHRMLCRRRCLVCPRI